MEGYVRPLRIWGEGSEFPLRKYDSGVRIWVAGTPELVTVAFRELGEGGVWCCGAGEPEPAALLSCDIRRGRPREQRAELAQTLIDACVETLGLRSDRLVVEFTQHTPDEMYRAGRGWAAEWTPAEATIRQAAESHRQERRS